jgi:hypothetical protein
MSLITKRMHDKKVYSPIGLNHVIFTRGKCMRRGSMGTANSLKMK